MILTDARTEDWLHLVRGTPPQRKLAVPGSALERNTVTDALIEEARAAAVEQGAPVYISKHHRDDCFPGDLQVRALADLVGMVYAVVTPDGAVRLLYGYLESEYV